MIASGIFRLESSYSLHVYLSSNIHQSSIIQSW